LGRLGRADRVEVRAAGATASCARLMGKRG
jgi:hypothetical protein